MDNFESPEMKSTDVPVQETTPKAETFTESRPVVEEREIKGAMQFWPRQTFFLEGLGAFYEANHSNKERLKQGDLYSPRGLYIDRVMRDDSNFVQHIKHNDRVIGLTVPKLRTTGGNVSGRAALELLRKSTNTGGSMTMELPHTGIRVTMEPAVESKFIDLEFTLSRAASQVGLSTTGLLLSARSAVFSETLIRFALGQIVSVNLPIGRDEMIESLLDIIDPLDYGVLIGMVLATKFANGHPWEFECVSSECDWSQTAMLNFARMMWFDKNALTERQLDILSLQRNLTEKELEEYREEFGSKTGDTITLTNGQLIKLKRGTLRRFIESANRWVSDVERTYNSALTSYTTEARRNDYLNAIMQSRRMLKYEHFVDEIHIPGDIEGEYHIIDQPEDIRESLKILSTISEDFKIFELEIDKYLEEATIAVFGYPSRRCPKCNYEHDYGDGRLRSIVPIAVDRLLFTLVQQRNSDMSQMADV